MRIIHILNSPNWSGASHYCVTLCDRLGRRGHEILLLTEPGKPLERARKLGIPFDDTIRLNHRNPGLYLHGIKRMEYLFKHFKPDIITSHINEGAWMAGMVARETARQAAVVRTRTDIDPPKSHFINRFVHHRWTDHLIVSSQLHKKLCCRLLDFPADGIDVVYGAVDTDQFKPRPDVDPAFRREIGATPETVVIGMVARLDPVKGHEYALQALQLLRATPVPHLLVALGYENQRSFSWLMEEARRLGVADRVRHFGWRDDLPTLVSQMDIGLIASTGSEANCRVALEFMAAGKPIVATTVGVIPEILVDGEQGFLAPPCTVEPLAQGVARLLTNPSLRLRLGRQALEHCRANFGLDLFAQRTEHVYQHALKRRQQILGGSS